MTVSVPFLTVLKTFYPAFLCCLSLLRVSIKFMSSAILTVVDPVIACNDLAYLLKDYNLHIYKVEIVS